MIFFLLIVSLCLAAFLNDSFFIRETPFFWCFFFFLLLVCLFFWYRAKGEVGFSCLFVFVVVVVVVVLYVYFLPVNFQAGRMTFAMECFKSTINILRQGSVQQTTTQMPEFTG